MRLVKRLKCLWRGHHRYAVPYLVALCDPRLSYSGVCKDCGSVRRRTGWYWRKYCCPKSDVL
jgi:hypothetical protein